MSCNHLVVILSLALNWLCVTSLGCSGLFHPVPEAKSLNIGGSAKKGSKARGAGVSAPAPPTRQTAAPIKPSKKVGLSCSLLMGMIIDMHAKALLAIDDMHVICRAVLGY